MAAKDASYVVEVSYPGPQGAKGADGADGAVQTVNSTAPDAQGNVVVDTGVMTVNGAAPDSFGNVSVATGGGSATAAPATLASFDVHRMRSKNTLSPLDIPGYTGSPQLVEHSVLSAPNGVVDNSGHKWYYVMASSDYKDANTVYEQLQLRVSTDRTTWSKPTNAPDPLVDASPSGGRIRASTVFFGSDGTTVYIAYSQVDSTGQYYYEIHSSDLVTWSAPALLGSNTDTANYNINSLSVLWQDGVCHLWAVENKTAVAVLHTTGAGLADVFAGISKTPGTSASAPSWTVNDIGSHAPSEINVRRIGCQFMMAATFEYSGHREMHLATSYDGQTWDAATAPILRPMMASSSLWDLSILRADIGLLSGGADGPRLAVWYGGLGPNTQFRLGYTEAWLRPDHTNDRFYELRQPGRYYPNDLATLTTSSTPGVGDLTLYPAYSGEDGLKIDKIMVRIVGAVANSQVYGGVYIVNDQLHPYRWVSGQAWATLLVQGPGYADGSSVGNIWYQLPDTYIPPRTWFAVGGYQLVAACEVAAGMRGSPAFSPFGADLPYLSSNYEYVALRQSNITTSSLPQSFVPTSMTSVDSGHGYLSHANQPVF